MHHRSTSPHRAAFVRSLVFLLVVASFVAVCVGACGHTPEPGPAPYDTTGGSTGGNGVGGGGGGLGVGGGVSCSDYAMSLRGGETLSPSVVRVYFQLLDCDGNAPDPTTIETDDFTILEDGETISIFESSAEIIPSTQAFELATLLLLDMSGSIIDSGNLPALQTAAQSFVDSLDDAQQLAIYTFDGRQTIEVLIDFTDDGVALGDAIDSLTSYVPQDNSTNLNGAVIQSLDVLDARQAQFSDRIVAGSVAVFTDGRDQASYQTDAEAIAASTSSRHSIFAIGLGPDVDAQYLEAVGKDGAVLASDVADLQSAFDAVAASIENLVKSLYVIAYCSPSRMDDHTLALGIGTANLQFCFDADGFTGGCEPSNFLDPGGNISNDCPVNSGWPCTCTGQSCSDGSWCLYDQPNTDTYGWCMPSCTSDESCPCSNTASDAACVDAQDVGKVCLLYNCSSVADCPTGQACIEVEGYTYCVPIQP